MNKCTLELVLAWIGIFVIVVIIASADVSAQEAVLKTVVHDNGCPLIADGRHKYQLDVWLNNSEFNEASEGVRWRVDSPNDISFNVVRVEGTQEKRPKNDFFMNKSMYFEFVRPKFWQLHARLTDLGQGVIGEGNLASYWFSINPIQQNYGRTKFDLGVVEIIDHGGNPQHFRIENQEFAIRNVNSPVTSIKCLD